MSILDTLFKKKKTVNKVEQIVPVLHNGFSGSSGSYAPAKAPASTLLGKTATQQGVTQLRTGAKTPALTTPQVLADAMQRTNTQAQQRIAADRQRQAEDAARRQKQQEAVNYVKNHPVGNGVVQRTAPSGSPIINGSSTAQTKTAPSLLDTIMTGKSAAAENEARTWKSKGIDTEQEKAAYQAGQLLNSKNPYIGGVTYPLTRLAAGALSLGDVVNHGAGWAEKGLGKLTGSKTLTSMGDEALKTNLSESMAQGIEDTVHPGKAEGLLGELAGQIGGVAAASAAGAPLESLKVPASIAPKIGIGLQSAVQSETKARDEGASAGNALKYGALNGMMNAATEGIAGGIPGLGEGSLDPYIAKLPGLAQIGANMVGEGAENALQEALDPVTQRLTYNKNAQSASGKELLSAFGWGAALSGVMEGAGAMVSGLPEQENVDTQIGRNLKVWSGENVAETARSLIETGQEYAPDTKARKTADNAADLLQRNGELTEKQLGRLWRANAETQRAEAQSYFYGKDMNPYTRTVNGQTVLPTAKEINSYELQKVRNDYARKVAAQLQQYNVRGVIMTELPAGEEARWDNGAVYVSSKLDTASAINAKIGHEIAHASAESDAAFVDDVLKVAAESGTDVAAEAARKKAVYEKWMKDQKLTPDEIAVQTSDARMREEVACDFIGKALVDGDLAQRLTDRPKLAEKLLTAVNSLRGHSSVSQPEAARYAVLAGKLRAAVDAGGEVQLAPTGTEGARYSIDENFTKNIDEWDGTSDKTFAVGTTSDALQSIGVEDRNIVWHSDKISRILKKHSLMTIDLVKQVPNILENPIIILKSKTVPSRIVIFGDVKSKDGNPVTAILELQPTNKGGELLDMNLINSAYVKDKAPAQFIENSDVVYLDPDKKRTSGWLQGLGLQLPSDTTALGSIGSVSYQDGNVKIEGVPFKEIVQGNEKNAGAENTHDEDYMNGLVEDAEKRDTPVQPWEETERQKQADLDDYWKLCQNVADPTASTVQTADTPEEKVLAKYVKPEILHGVQFKESWYHFKRNWVDSGEAVDRIGKATGDKYLYAYYNMARGSSNAANSMILNGQTDISGKIVGKSLSAIFEPIMEKGDDYYKAFELYLYHLHNVERMSRFDSTKVTEAKEEFKKFQQAHLELQGLSEKQIERFADSDSALSKTAKKFIWKRDKMLKAQNTVNKPVFNHSVKAEDSRAEAGKLLTAHPEFAKMRDEVYQYIDNLLQYRIDSGLITEDDYKKLKSIYPHYVPTYRATETEGSSHIDRNSVQIGKTIKRAEGGSGTLLPLHEALAKQTRNVVRESAKNRFGMRLINNENLDSIKEHISEIREYEPDFSEDNFDDISDDTPQKGNTFLLRNRGKLMEMDVSPALFDAVKALSPDSDIQYSFDKYVRAVNDTFKKLVTEWNPMFVVRNFLRDAQDASFYSAHLRETAAQYPEAWKEMQTNGKYWRMYQALGGTSSSLFDFLNAETGDNKGKGAEFYDKTIGRVQVLNEMVEQAPRLAEFMATVKNGNGSYENLMQGMLDAADVTVNFGRSGRIGKYLNANVVPFLNPGIQGFDKMVRTVTETKGMAPWLKLTAKAALFGILPKILNGLLYRDDDEWKDLKDNDKDLYYLFKIKDGVWLKFPKGRTYAAMSLTESLVKNLMNGEQIDFLQYAGNLGAQVAPANPLESNIFAPIMTADLFDPKSPGKTWYGGDIESERLQGYEAGQRYDEKTDVVSKWLGGKLGLSPKKINYIIDQYSGVVGDILLPLLTPQAEQNPFTSAFTMDSTASNRLSGEFYDTLDKLNYRKNDPNSDGTAAATYKFWSKQNALVSDVNKKIREIENDRYLTDKEKRELVQAQETIRNNIERNALDKLTSYENAVSNNYAKAETNAPDEAADYAYRQANREIFGAEYALSAYSQDIYKKAAELQKCGVSYDDFYDVYFEDYSALKTNDRLSGTQRSVELIRKLVDRGFDSDKISAIAGVLDAKTAVGKFTDLTSAGVSEKNAIDIAAGLAALKPAPGKSDVSFVQKLQVISSSSLNDEEKLAAVNAELDDTTVKKMNQASGYGINVDTYTQFQSILPNYDYDGSGKYSGKEVEAALNDMNLTNSERAVLWQLRTGYKNDPFDRTIGANIRAEAAADKQAAKAASGNSILTDIFGAAAAPAGGKTTPDLFASSGSNTTSSGTISAEEIHKILYG